MRKTTASLLAGLVLLLLFVPGAVAFECDEAYSGSMSYDEKASVGKIVRGDAWTKHVFSRTGSLYGVFRDQAEFERHLLRIVTDGNVPCKIFEQAKKAFWDEASGVVIILDPTRKDCGTAFRPWEGRDYYDRQQ